MNYEWWRNSEETVLIRIRKSKERYLDKGGSWILGKEFLAFILNGICVAVEGMKFWER